MVQVPSELKRLFLQSIFDQLGGGISLLDALKAFSLAQFTQLQSGRLIVSTAGGGYSTTLKMPGSGRFEQDQVGAMAQQFREIYSDVISNALVAIPPVTLNTDGTDDATILASMLADDRMQGVRTSMIDVTGLRYPVTGPYR